jgi:hypothetical protein
VRQPSYRSCQYVCFGCLPSIGQQFERLFVLVGCRHRQVGIRIVVKGGFWWLFACHRGTTSITSTLRSSLYTERCQLNLACLWPFLLPIEGDGLQSLGCLHTEVLAPYEGDGLRFVLGYRRRRPPGYFLAHTSIYQLAAHHEDTSLRTPTAHAQARKPGSHNLLRKYDSLSHGV